MKVVILAGGRGTRLSEETGLRPKPLVEIGGKPILWHIMKLYSYWGFNDFVILTGYMSHVIKDYFINYYTRYSDITIDMATNSVEVLNNRNEPWKVTMLYTGQDTMTATRIYRAKEYLKDDTFMLTYGDGIGDINIQELYKYHKQSGKVATVTSIQPAGRFGSLEINSDGSVESFREKVKSDSAWINGGFFVLEPEIFEYINPSEDNMFEKEPMDNLTAKGQLVAYKHTGFWRAMDTLRDKNELTELWNSGKAPWALWNKGK